MSRFLSYGDWTCWHDEARHVRSVDDVRSWLSQEKVGSVETAAAPFWRLVRQIRPDANVVVVRRPIDEVITSLVATKIPFDHSVMTRHLRRLDRKLDHIERGVPGVLSVRFADLADETTCQQIFEHCLPYHHDSERWRHLSGINLQINLSAMFRYERAHAPQLRRAEALCARQIKAFLLSAKVRHGPVDARGISIQEEPAAAVYRDGQALFSEHCLAVGEPEDEWTRKNIPLMFRLEETGSLHLVTARCNGRMLGYLKTVIGPSMERVGVLCGTQTLFFASRDALGMGLGESLQKASIAALSRRGVTEIYMREGVRGSGPKLGVLYRRLGASDHGHLYRLKMEAA